MLRLDGRRVLAEAHASAPETDAVGVPAKEYGRGRLTGNETVRVQRTQYPLDRTVVVQSRSHEQAIDSRDQAVPDLPTVDQTGRKIDSEGTGKPTLRDDVRERGSNRTRSAASSSPRRRWSRPRGPPGTGRLGDAQQEWGLFRLRHGQSLQALTDGGSGHRDQLGASPQSPGHLDRAAHNPFATRPEEAGLSELVDRAADRGTRRSSIPPDARHHA